MIEQTRQALTAFNTAHIQLAEGLAALKSISDRTGSGADCACGDGASCAYHADLINRTVDARLVVSGLLTELLADMSTPGRAH